MTRVKDIVEESRKKHRNSDCLLQLPHAGVLDDLMFQVKLPLLCPDIVQGFGIKPISGLTLLILRLEELCDSTEEICLDVPDEKAREEILSVCTRHLSLDSNFDCARIARLTSGFVGADFHALAKKAGIVASKEIGPELLSKYVGDTEKAIRELFSRARMASPCIIFFDEVDALTTKRGEQGAWVVERPLNQLLVELSGGKQREGVIVIAATNRPDMMDPAVQRSGRFGRHIYVSLPNPDQRYSILKSLVRDIPIDLSVDL
ncbi:unnamed protein product [Arabis nemorensis]|uniref:ATPase AAA-type core domain-containing protein n=1 Tax=Arabis nemorensis TaxID=586526 RepID=A0A565BS70_9BRAS|nr:unnamed protein product [Arabis nemorensis]